MDSLQTDKQETHKCQICEKIFAYNSSLIKHMRIHTGERPYACNFEGCNQKFSQVSNLIRHKRIHSGIRPYTCKDCGKCFSSSSNLKQHTNIHKATLKRNKFCCLVGDCEKSYLYICTLKKHMIFSHKSEFEILEEMFKGKNFFEIFKIIKARRDNQELKDSLPFLKVKGKESEIVEEEDEEEAEEMHLGYLKNAKMFINENTNFCKETALTSQKNSSDQLPTQSLLHNVQTAYPQMNFQPTNYLNFNNYYNLLNFSIESEVDKWNIIVKMLELEKLRVINKIMNNNHNNNVSPKMFSAVNPFFTNQYNQLYNSNSSNLFSTTSLNPPQHALNNLFYLGNSIHSNDSNPCNIMNNNPTSNCQSISNSMNTMNLLQLMSQLNFNPGLDVNMSQQLDPSDKEKNN